MKPLFGIGAYLSKSALEQSLLELVSFRVSQINGCAYCLDMHSKDLRVKGETEQRLYTSIMPGLMEMGQEIKKNF